MQGILQITSKDFINSNTKYHLLSLQVRIHYNLYSRNDPKDHLPWIYSSLLRLSQRSLELAGFHCRRFGVTNMTRKTTRYIASENLTNLLLNLSILLFFLCHRYITMAPNIANFTAIRTVRVLRALRTISVISGKRLLNVLKSTT